MQTVQDGVLLLTSDRLVAVGLVEALEDVLEDALHPGPPLLPEVFHHLEDVVSGPVPVGEQLGVQEVDAGDPLVVGKVYQVHLLHQLPGDQGQQRADQVAVGVDDHDGVGVLTLGLATHLVGEDVLHQGGLSHAGLGDVEVVLAKQVVGEEDLPVLAVAGGLADGRALPYSPGEGRQQPGPRPLHEWHLLLAHGEVPQRGYLPGVQDAPPLPGPASGQGHGVVRHTVRFCVFFESVAGGQVVVVVSRGDAAQHALGPVSSRIPGHDGGDPELRQVGGTRDLLLHQAVVVKTTCLLVEGSDKGNRGDDGTRNRRVQQHGRQYVSVLDPQVVPQPQGDEPQHRDEGDTLPKQSSRLVLVGGVQDRRKGRHQGPTLVSGGPVRRQRVQYQPGHQPLALVHRAESAQHGQHGVGADVEKVVVPEGAQGEPLRPRQGQDPGDGGLPVAQRQGVVLARRLLHPGLGIVDGDLAAHGLG